MAKISKSPERHTFQKEVYIKRCEEEGKEPNHKIIAMYESWLEKDEEQIKDSKWQKNNMEYDLRSNKELCDKVKASDNYAQNLYAAMCNMTWQSREFWQEMKGETWSCSWRHAGGIVADMQEKGDYINWYCSGIGSQKDGYGICGQKPELDEDDRTYVPEGHVTEEIELDLNRLGWRPVPWEDD